MANITASLGNAGLRATNNFITNADPESWRPGFSTLWPNGDLPMAALTNRMKKRVVKSVNFNWFDKLPGNMSGKIEGIYTDSALSSAYTSGGVDGSIVYIKLGVTNGRTAAETAVTFVRGNGVVIRDNTDPTLDVVGKVIDVQVNGTSSYLAVRLLEADDNSLYSRDLSDAVTDGIVVQMGTINPEGGEPPNAVGANPDQFSNRTQIFKDTIEITGSARQTELRYANSQYDMDQVEALYRHGQGMEGAFLWGVSSNKIGTNGKPERTTRGLINTIRTYAPDNVFTFNLASGYSGKTWVESGEAFLDAALTQIFKYGSDEKMVFAGAGAISGLNTIAKAYGNINISPNETSYGLKVTKWNTPWGSVALKRHPMFTQWATLNNAMVIFEPKNLTYVVLGNRDTKLMKDGEEKRNSGHLDMIQDYYMTECGLEYHFPQTNGLIFGVGLDNSV